MVVWCGRRAAVVPGGEAPKHGKHEPCQYAPGAGAVGKLDGRRRTVGRMLHKRLE